MSERKLEPMFPQFVGVKLSDELADELKRAAARDDRTVSSFVRKTLRTVLAPTTPKDDDRG